MSAPRPRVKPPVSGGSVGRYGASFNQTSPGKRPGSYVPPITLRSVVFPAPLGPIRATFCPVSIAKDTSARTSRPPKCVSRDYRLEAASMRSTSVPAESGTWVAFVLTNPIFDQSESEVLGETPLQKHDTQHEDPPKDERPSVGQGMCGNSAPRRRSLLRPSKVHTGWPGLP